jgi:hypothetical protein
MIMETRTIDFNYLTNAEMYQYATDYLGIGRRIGFGILGIEKPINTLVIPALANFDLAYKQERKSDFTDGIGALDKLRDNKTSGIRRIIEAAAFDSDPKKVEASKKGKKWLGEFKGINKKPFKAQSADTTNFIQGFRGKYAPEVEILGLGKWLDELEEINNQIIAMFGERIDEKKEKGKLSTEETRKKLVSSLRTVDKLVDVLVETDGAEKYADFIASVNILIGEYVGGSGKSTPPAEENLPEPPTQEETHEEKMAKARPYTEINEGEWKNGDYCWHNVNSVKTYYKLLDATQKAVKPYFSGGEAVWEKVS